MELLYAQIIPRLSALAGRQIHANELATPEAMPQDVFVALNGLADELGAIAAGNTTVERGNTVQLLAVNRMLDRAPWSMDPEFGAQRMTAEFGVELDNQLLQSIARNVDKLNTGQPGLQAAHLVLRDIAAFRKIQAPEIQRHAAAEIADSINDHADYKAAFMNASSRHPGMLEHMAALNAMTKLLVAEKETRKVVEFVAYSTDPELIKAMGIVPPDFATTSQGLHIGPIVAIHGSLIAQKVGREPDKVVWHDMRKLQGDGAVVGAVAEVSYTNGVGILKGPGQEVNKGISR